MPLSVAGAVVICWLSVVIAAGFLGTRLYVRYWLQRCLTASDGCLVLSFLILFYLMITDMVLLRLGQWDVSLADANAISDARHRIPNPEVLRRILKILWSAGPLYYLSLWLVKAAFILFYYTFITRTFEKLRIALNVTAFITFFGFLVGEALTLFYCIPVSRNWALDDTFCSSFSKDPAYYLMMGVHFFSDAAIYTLPFFVLPYLRLTYRQKVGISFIFALGSLTILAAVARVLVVGTAFNQASVNALSAVEMCTGISVASTPPLKWLFAKMRRDSQAVTGDAVRSDEPSANSGMQRERERLRERERMRRRDGEMEWGTFIYKGRHMDGDNNNGGETEDHDDGDGYHDYVRSGAGRGSQASRRILELDERITPVKEERGNEATIRTNSSIEAKGSSSPDATSPLSTEK